MPQFALNVLNYLRHLPKQLHDNHLKPLTAPQDNPYIIFVWIGKTISKVPETCSAPQVTLPVVAYIIQVPFAA